MWTLTACCVVSCCLSLWGEADAQACPPPNFAPINELDLAAFTSQPWFVRAYRPTPSVPETARFCQRVVFTPLIPTNVSAGFVASATGSLNDANGALLTLDMLGGAVTNTGASSKATGEIDPMIQASQGPPGAAASPDGGQDGGRKTPIELLQAAVQVQNMMVLIPAEAGTGRLAVARAQNLQSPVNLSELAAVWVVAAGAAPPNTARPPPLNPSTSSLLYDWVLITSGPPSVASANGCGCTFDGTTLKSAIAATASTVVNVTADVINRIANATASVHDQLRSTASNTTECDQEASDEVHSSLKDTLNDIKDKVKEAHSQVREHVRNAAEKVRDVARDIAESVRDIFRGRRLLQEAAAPPVIVPLTPVPSGSVSPDTTSTAQTCALPPVSCIAQNDTLRPAATHGEGRILLLSRRADDPESLAAMQAAAKDLGLDLSQLVTTCQQGCWK